MQHFRAERCRKYQTYIRISPAAHSADNLAFARRSQSRDDALSSSLSLPTLLAGALLSRPKVQTVCPSKLSTVSRHSHAMSRLCQSILLFPHAYRTLLTSFSLRWCRFRVCHTEGNGKMSSWHCRKGLDGKDFWYFQQPCVVSS